MRQRKGEVRCPRYSAAGMIICALFLALCSSQATQAKTIIGRNGMVTTSDHIASQAGLRILQQGGNAFDAAIASAAVLAVVRPFGSGIGGVGGYALLYDAKTGETLALDFIGNSPKAAAFDTYRGDKLWDFAKRATTGYLAPLVPGIVAGWAAIHERYGSMSWAKIMAPAIEYAANGFPLDRSMKSNAISEMRRNPYGRKIFSNGTRPWQAGEIWVQKDLAKTLKAIATNGPEEFYKGETAKKIAKHFQEHGGLITEADLAAYQVRWNDPISTTYRGFRVMTHGPGSSGMTIIQWLNVLEGFNLGFMGHNSGEYIHLVTETMKRGFLDDDRYNTGMPASDLLLQKLISKEYAVEQRERINLGKAQFYPPYIPDSVSKSGEHTSHHTVVDKNHNIVTITQTLMVASGVIVPETGIFFNNGMCYFHLEPGHQDRLKGGVRPRFVMSPTIIFRGKKPYFALGSAGGWTIPQTILQTILNLVDFRMEVQKAASSPRLILRYLKNSIPYVPGTELSLAKEISDEARKYLEARGHFLIYSSSSVTRALNTILIDPKSGALWGSGGVATW